MKYQRTLVVLSAVLVFAVAGCGEKQEEGKKKTITDVKELIETRCTSCHFSDRIFKKPRTAEKWANLVSRMHSMNPDVMTREEAISILTYLQKNNSVPAEQAEPEEKEVDVAEEGDEDSSGDSLVDEYR